MTAIPAWAARWIGVPYRDKGRGPDAFDCWGLVRAILRAERGLPLPDYADAYTTADAPDSVARAVAAGLADGWREMAEPQAFDLLILRIAGRPWHCALMLTREQFIHCPPPAPHGVQTGACIERLDAPRWARRIDGFWRHVPAGADDHLGNNA